MKRDCFFFFSLHLHQKERQRENSMERDSERPKTHEVLPFFSHLNQLLYKLAEKSGMQPVLCARVALTYASSHSHLFLSLSLFPFPFFLCGVLPVICLRAAASERFLLCVSRFLRSLFFCTFIAVVLFFAQRGTRRRKKKTSRASKEQHS
jgi:hypothetical protein